MGITQDDDSGRQLPTATASRLKMLEDIPDARPMIPDDLMEMILGEDAVMEELEEESNGDLAQAG